MRFGFLLLAICLCTVPFSCKKIWGSKDDPTVNEILQQGKIDPKLIPSTVGYVPIQPFWNGFDAPTDVYVGYDEMVYVTDAKGLRVCDQTGAIKLTIPFDGASDVTQDRRLHTYVAAFVSLSNGGNTFRLPAVYHLINTATTGWSVIDTLIQPFCDKSRNPVIQAADTMVSFTGLATTADNLLYVSRTGPRNDPAGFSATDNNILIFTKDGTNTGVCYGLTPNVPSLKSVLGVSGIATFAGPPQKVIGMNASQDFIITQSDPRANLEFRTLWIKQSVDPDLGVVYAENTNLLSTDTSKAKDFLYRSHRFTNPTDVYVAPDQTGYMWVIDAGTDSLYQFTTKGYEGVNPPANFGSTKQLVVSFGGTGSGPFQFNGPTGVCYYRRMVFVADKGNNRICRYKLSTDLDQ